MKMITVKGTARVSAKPDLIVIQMNLESRDKAYGQAMALAGKRLNELLESLASVGFERETVKTTEMHVETEYDSEEDEKGRYQSVFKGFLCTHRLKLEFDFDTSLLASTLAAVAQCPAKPQFSIAFSVKDQEGVRDELLRSAAENAAKRALLLCDASGVRLGQLVSIHYAWDRIDLVSPTSFRMLYAAKEEMADSAMNIRPDDIDVSDEVTFVWEIIPR